MNINVRRWLACAQSHGLTNSKHDISYWAYAMLKASTLTDKEKDKAKRGLKTMIAQDKLKGDISEKWIEDGFTNEQFRNELYL